MSQSVCVFFYFYLCLTKGRIKLMLMNGKMHKFRFNNPEMLTVKMLTSAEVLCVLAGKFKKKNGCNASQ